MTEAYKQGYLAGKRRGMWLHNHEFYNEWQEWLAGFYAAKAEV